MSQEIKRLKITVGILSAGEFLHRHFVESLINLKYPENTDVQFSVIYGVQIPFARNQVISDAMTNNSEYVLWLDSDMTFPPDLLTRLIVHQKLVVGALAFRRQYPHFPTLFKWREDIHCYETIHYEKDTQLVEVDATGHACLLVDMKVFSELKKPYFYYREHKFSSDLTWCYDVKKLGIPIFIDCTLKTGHIGNSYIATEKDYLKDKNPEAIKEYNRAFLKELYRS